MMAREMMSRSGSVVEWDVDNRDMAVAGGEGKGIAHLP